MKYQTTKFRAKHWQNVPINDPLLFPNKIKRKSNTWVVWTQRRISTSFVMSEARYSCGLMKSWKPMLNITKVQPNRHTVLRILYIFLSVKILIFSCWIWAQILEEDKNDYGFIYIWLLIRYNIINGLHILLYCQLILLRVLFLRELDRYQVLKFMLWWFFVLFLHQHNPIIHH